MKALLALGLAVFAAHVLSFPNNHVQKRSTSCTISNMTYEDGSSFTLPDQSICFIYNCDAGKVFLAYGGCAKNETHCAEVGDTWDAGSCVTYKCSKRRSEEGYDVYKTEIDQLACQSRSGTCFNVGSSWNEGCTTYNCTTEVRDQSMYLVSSIISTGCEGPNGTCHSVNSNWTIDCTTYHCYSEKTEDGHTQLVARVVAVDCIDANNKCRKPGEMFPKIIDKTLHQHCNCTILASYIYYSCPQV